MTWIPPDGGMKTLAYDFSLLSKLGGKCQAERLWEMGEQGSWMENA
jgi:hypothetical protein